LGFLQPTRTQNSRHKQGGVMAKQGMKTNASRGSVSGTFEIEKDQWDTFLADFTRENRGAHARLEVLGAEVSHQVETENLPFEGVSTDGKHGEQGVWITFCSKVEPGSKLEQHISHGIQNAKAIWVRLPSGEAGAALEVMAKDGTKTLLQLSRPERHGLSSATCEASSVSA
jgi:hypothetical protein